MKKLRNIFCAALALLLAMSCAACSKSADSETTSGAESDTQVTVISADGTTAKTVISNDGGTIAQNGETKNQPAAGGDNAQEPESPDGGSGQRETVRVTITEGMTLTQIFKKLEANGVCSFNDLMKTAESYDYSYYPHIAARP